MHAYTRTHITIYVYVFETSFTINTYPYCMYSLACIYPILFHFLPTVLITHHTDFTNLQFEKQCSKETAYSHQNGSFSVSTMLRYRLNCWQL